MRVYLVDGQPVFREGLKSIIATMRDLTVIGEADNCEEALQKYRLLAEQNPDTYLPEVATTLINLAISSSTQTCAPALVADGGHHCPRRMST